MSLTTITWDLQIYSLLIINLIIVKWDYIKLYYVVVCYCVSISSLIFRVECLRIEKKILLCTKAICTYVINRFEKIYLVVFDFINSTFFPSMSLFLNRRLISQPSKFDLIWRFMSPVITMTGSKSAWQSLNLYN